MTRPPIICTMLARADEVPSTCAVGQGADRHEERGTPSRRDRERGQRAEREHPGQEPPQCRVPTPRGVQDEEREGDATDGGGLGGQDGAAEHDVEIEENGRQ